MLSKVNRLLLLILLCLLSIGPLEGAQLHAILVVDSSQGEGLFEGNLDCMQREVKRIATYTGLELNALTFEGYQVRIENVLKTLNQLTIEPEDVVLLYFNLHGSRNSSKENKWPDLNFSFDILLSGESGYLDFDVINEMVKEKNPRFLLSIAESCNDFRDRSSILDNQPDESTEVEELPYELLFDLQLPLQINLDSIERKLINHVAKKETIAAYRHLFLDQTGSVIVSSASPGERALGLPITGGVFTIDFLTVLMNCKGEEASWPFILERVQLMARKGLEGHKQSTPQYEIDLMN